ncbi:MAG TPA: transcriptional repressor [Actinobacteria bacterium]|nr:transcriptional repressor [Actinomycetota bacterium]
MDAIPESTHEREQAFADALRADGLRMTHQRLEVIRELASATHHPDADELFRAVRERVPTISRDTVYRTLTTLAARRLIERIAAPGAARFDPDSSMHHHFVCTECGRILDLDAGDLGEPEVPSGLPGIGEITSVRLEIKGVCGECAAHEKVRTGDGGS